MISTGDTGCAFGTSGHIQWRARIGGNNGRVCGGALAAGQWQHIAATYDGSHAVIYVDGVEVANVARSGALASSTQQLTLGNTPTLDRAFDGDMDDVRIWKIARSAAEIQASRVSELAGTETGLVAYYRLNAGAGQSAPDETANHNHGTLGTSNVDDSADPFWRSSGTANSPPFVDAGSNVTLPISEALALNGTASDDGLPAGTLTTWWSELSGPGPVAFLDPGVPATTASFPVTGSYVLQLEADDGEATTRDTLTVTVTDEIEDPGVWPTNGWVKVTPAVAGMNSTLLSQAKAYALNGGGSGFITRGGKLVMSWGSTSKLYDLKSSTKSIGGSILGFALDDQLLTLPNRPQSYLPGFGTPPSGNETTGWLDDITFLQLATHTAGFAKDRNYGPLRYQPGTTWSYSDGGFNWLADTLTVIYGQDLSGILTSRMLSPLGLSSTNLTWRNSESRGDTINGIKRREFSSGISASVDAMARIGYLYLRRGRWADQRILSEEFTERVGHPDPQVVGLPVNAGELPVSANHYGVMWWTNADGALPQVPRDAFWTWGLGDSIILVIPSLDIVVARAGNKWRTGGSHDYSIFAPFFNPIVQSVQP